MNKEKISFAQRFKSLRMSREVSMSQLADSLSTSKSTISKYENGHLHPRKDALVKIAEFFNCSIDYLVGLTDDPSANGNTYNDIEKKIITKEDCTEINSMVDTLIKELESSNHFTLDGDIIDENHKKLLMDSLKSTLNFVRIQTKSDNYLHTLDK